jgi:hypothetical protein
MPFYLEDDGCNESQPLEAIPGYDDVRTLEDLQNPEDAEADRAALR